METVAVENTPEEISVQGLLSATFHAHALELNLHLLYWRTESKWDIEYHTKQSKESYEKLTEEMRKAGIIE